mmetsp:Transcript_37325/g.94643  ORF Transcript_37325/g.94643 Transcript_37325/m.94643 type:complete len:300 (-) Transcript_37325:496-1395(-)
MNQQREAVPYYVERRCSFDGWIERGRAGAGRSRCDLGAIWVRPPRHVTERRAGPSWIVRAPSLLTVLAVEVVPVDSFVPIERRRVISQRDSERLLETARFLEVRNDVDVQLRVLELRRWVNRGRGTFGHDERRGALVVFCQLFQPYVHPVAVDHEHVAQLGGHRRHALQQHLLPAQRSDAMYDEERVRLALVRPIEQLHEWFPFVKLLKFRCLPPVFLGLGTEAKLLDPSILPRLGPLLHLRFVDGHHQHSALGVALGAVAGMHAYRGAKVEGRRLTPLAEVRRARVRLKGRLREAVLV